MPDVHLPSETQPYKQNHDQKRSDNSCRPLRAQAQDPQRNFKFIHDTALLSEKSEERIVLVRGLK